MAVDVGERFTDMPQVARGLPEIDAALHHPRRARVAQGVGVTLSSSQANSLSRSMAAL